VLQPRRQFPDHIPLHPQPPNHQTPYPVCPPPPPKPHPLNPGPYTLHRAQFGMFHDYVGQHFSAIASGHYAQQRVSRTSGKAQLIMSPDPVKDQTYFLCNLNQQQV
jgi:hypothetical protein